ncbi:DNA sulfur modification protein DndB [Brevibacterium sanguinis]|uniref:DNA sulfur modification protein DndB n=2 Tax=Brevibacterium TaxID=1696 RepID=A0A366IQL7_9MICO|nr:MULTISPECIES: DGQHR domain-containing protein [Brevibacterium]RBP67791.1 DNA sulfur modification protein DndB [Brevibacterium sanguinis]RBP74792.1 DNA sulfur modification protein DndB [Brevibacterium celere]
MSDGFNLLDKNKIRSEIIRRQNPYLREKIPYERRSEYENSAKGWVLDKELKTSIWMRRPKPHDVLFEDRVWAMCARLGFDQINADRNLRIQYGKEKNEAKQIDVLAADDEVVLVIECKSSNADKAPTHQFKGEIEAISGYRPGLIRSLRNEFPGRKIKFIFAASNIAVSKNTINRIESSDIAYLDEEAIDYYHELADHLGSASKFQLLGNLFHGQKISAMNTTVPAIRGKMGGYTYYSFAIEPERLLKIAYVLHRNNANTRWMPTYQRIIKKPRLKSVGEFIENGGFFPNSLIININNAGRPLKFDKVQKSDGTDSLGILHLPAKYRSAYVIDGQHRLYGYAHSDRAATELVPVVAFVDMPGQKQLEMFMDINENQQSVPKNLRLTLKTDLEWESPDMKRQAEALKLKVAQLLGEQKTSPLRGRVVIGEEKASERRCISLDAIGRGIDRGGFIGEFTKNSMKKAGSFYRGSIDATLEPLTDFLELCFDRFRIQLAAQWDLGRGEGGFVFTNAGTEAILRVTGDVVDFLISEGTIDPLGQTPDELFPPVCELLDIVIEYIDGLSPDQVSEFRTWLGSGGPTRYWRNFQGAIVARRRDFQPEGYREWLRNQEKQFNSESYTMINDIENFLRDDIRRNLEDEFGSDWYKIGVPKQVYQEAQSTAAAKNYDSPTGVSVSWWDCLYIVSYQKILLHFKHDVWLRRFDSRYTMPSSQGSARKAKVDWMNQLNDIRNDVMHNRAVTEDQFTFLQSVYSHFVVGSGRRET